MNNRDHTSPIYDHDQPYTPIALVNIWKKNNKPKKISLGHDHDHPPKTYLFFMNNRDITVGQLATMT